MRKNFIIYSDYNMKLLYFCGVFRRMLKPFCNKILNIKHLLL